MKGNKKKFASKIVDLFPQLDSSCFVDLFCGTLSIALEVGRRYPSIPVITNDIRMELYNLYKVIQNSEKKEKLVKKIQNAWYHEVLFKEAKEKQFDFSDDIEAAFSFVYSHVNSLYGSAETMRFMEYNCDFINNALRYITMSLQKVQIMCGDFRISFSKINNNKRVPIFYYSDPPYLNTCEYHSSNSKIIWNEKDFDDLLALLLAQNSKFAISEFSGGYAEEMAREKGLFINFVCERCNIKNRATEILITNYKPQSTTLFDMLDQDEQHE